MKSTTSDTIIPGPQSWTAAEILTEYAVKKGWVTAKAGRPDIHRAGNASKCISFLPYINSPSSPPISGGGEGSMGILAARFELVARGSAGDGHMDTKGRGPR